MAAQDYQLAALRAHRFAKLIDFLLIIGAAAMGNLLQRMVIRDPAINVAVLPATLLLVWLMQSYCLLASSQTIGKMLAGIRLVSADSGGQPHWIQLLFLREPLSIIISLIPVIGQIYRIVDVLFMFREDRRCLHDHIAGTIVVKK